MFDGQDIMSAAQNLSRSAVADFFCKRAAACPLVLYQGAASQRGLLSRIKLLFPSLSSLLNIKDEVLTSVLKIAGLV